MLDRLISGAEHHRPGWGQHQYVTCASGRQAVTVFIARSLTPRAIPSFTPSTIGSLNNKLYLLLLPRNKYKHVITVLSRQQKEKLLRY